MKRPAQDITINDILRDAEACCTKRSQLKVFSQRGGNVNKHHLRAQRPAVIEHDGPVPQYIAHEHGLAASVEHRVSEILRRDVQLAPGSVAGPRRARALTLASGRVQRQGARHDER